MGNYWNTKLAFSFQMKYIFLYSVANIIKSPINSLLLFLASVLKNHKCTETEIQLVIEVQLKQAPDRKDGGGR